MELQIASGEGRGACFGDSGGPTFVVDSASSCLLLIGSTTGPGRNTDYSCESGGGTLMDLTRYQSWLSCAYKNLNQPHQELVASVNPTVACDSK
jgi:secreted trypsin-like serine protease